MCGALGVSCCLPALQKAVESARPSSSHREGKIILTDNASVSNDTSRSDSSSKKRSLLRHTSHNGERDESVHDLRLESGVREGERAGDERADHVRRCVLVEPCEEFCMCEMGGEGESDVSMCAFFFLLRLVRSSSEEAAASSSSSSSSSSGRVERARRHDDGSWAAQQRASDGCSKTTAGNRQW